MDDPKTLKYIVSACLAGEKCRYDGNSNTSDRIKSMVENGTAIPVCPEVLGGLPIPRARCEMRMKKNGYLSIIDENGNFYTDSFSLGAMKSLKIAERNGITKAILKSKSPSCGCGFIYDGSFSGKLIEGNGITAELFITSGIEVFTEIEFEKIHEDFKTST